MEVITVVAILLLLNLTCIDQFSKSSRSQKLPVDHFENRISLTICDGRTRFSTATVVTNCINKGFRFFVLIRQVVSFLLVGLLIANQAVLAACPHAHEEVPSDGRSERQHIHIGWPIHVHSYDPHDHDAHHHAYHHDDELLDAHQKSREDSCSSENRQQPCGHDCDAVYVAAQPEDFLPTAKQIEHKVLVNLIAIVRSIWASISSDRLVLRPIAHRGPFSQERCALFLQILSLRI